MPSLDTLFAEVTLHLQDPPGTDRYLCGATPDLGADQWGTSQREKVNCPDCLLRLASVGGGPVVPLQEADSRDADPAGPVPETLVSTAAPEVPPEYTTEDLLAALPFCHLSGAAGSGKTFLARKLMSDRDDTLFCATTGIAAVNLGDASTIHSALSYFNTQSLVEHYASGFLHYRLRMLRKSGVRILVVDEISMMEAAQLEILCAALDEIDNKKSYDEDLGLVTTGADDDGRMKLLLVGDFCQLPPVEGNFAFEMAGWESRFRSLKLTQIRRQGDRAFIEALQAVRSGHGELALPAVRAQFAQSLDLQFPGTTILAKNDAVDRMNFLRHREIPGTLYSCKTIRSGEQEKDWLRLIPEVLQIKKGALVMILANKPYPKLNPEDLTTFQYVNGDLGTVLGQNEQTGEIKVLLHRTLQEQWVEFATKEKKKATGKKNPRWEIKGAVTYMPLRLAYATTVHKSQGLTLDQVQVAIADGFFSSPGMLYVALSRARTLEGLRIVGTEKQFVGRCGVDERVRPWL